MRSGWFEEVELVCRQGLPHHICIMLGVSLLAWSLSATSVLAAAMSVAGIRCEYRDNPVAVDALPPRLSWVIESKERGVLQSAYRVLVASSADLLKKEQGFRWVKAEYDSIRGPVASSWWIEGDRFRLDLTFPPNRTATVCVPARDVKDVTESGRPMDRAREVKSPGLEDGRAVLEVGSGRYTFESRQFADPQP
jgi:hypothetical protein